MITAVDTSVLLDILLADPKFGETSKVAFKRCLAEGRMVVCEIVVAELTPFFNKSTEAIRALELFQVEFEPMNLESSLLAGHVFKLYRTSGGRRDRVVADFLIGAHALGRAERLLTRDRGYYRKYFNGLKVVYPVNA